MKAVTVHETDERDVLVSASEIIHLAIETHDRALSWYAIDVEAFGERSGELHEYSDTKSSLSASQLSSLINGVEQIIEGVFIGYSTSDSSIVTLIQLIDSSYYDICSSNASFMEQLSSSYTSIDEVNLEHCLAYVEMFSEELGL